MNEHVGTDRQDVGVVEIEERCVAKGEAVGVVSEDYLSFAVQGLGATILRRVVVELTDLGIKIIATQHDSITTEVPIAEAAAQEQIVTKVMQDVSARFLNGNPIRVDFHVYTDRFEDQKGAGDWARISGILQKYPE